MVKRRTARVTVGSAEFKARCLELVDRVKESRTEFVVTNEITEDMSAFELLNGAESELITP